jgi:hypothetical protein
MMDGAGCDGVYHEGRSRKYTITGCPDLFDKCPVNQLRVSSACKEGKSEVGENVEKYTSTASADGLIWGIGDGGLPWFASACQTDPSRNYTVIQGVRSRSGLVGRLPSLV